MIRHLPRLRKPLYRQSNHNTFLELKCKLLRYTSSFFPDAMTSWNDVITHFNDIPSKSLKPYFIADSSKEIKYFWYA